MTGHGRISTSSRIGVFQVEGGAGVDSHMSLVCGRSGGWRLDGRSPVISIFASH